MRKVDRAARIECAFVLEEALECDGFKHRDLPDGVDDDEFFRCVERLIKELRAEAKHQ